MTSDEASHDESQHEASQHEALRAELREGELTVLGQLRAASNATILCELPSGSRCVYKPVAGERPLWDFPDGTLARRELAFAGLDAALGIHAVPATVWREEGPFGAGMCQIWVEEDEDALLVDVVPAGSAGPGWVTAFTGEGEAGQALEVIHRGGSELQAIAVLDAVANNADRKAGHLIVDRDGRIRAIDHGVAFHVDGKLRTVLWGWAGEPIGHEHDGLVARIAEVVGSLPASITDWLDRDEVRTLESRLRRIGDERRFPAPSRDWPAIPWPLY